MNRGRYKPTLCIDFDGVVHSYTSGWKGAAVIDDPPVPGALRWLWKATEWFNVYIYSSRSSQPGGIIAMKSWLIVEAAKEFGLDHPMSDMKDMKNYPIKFSRDKPVAFLTIDDRCYCFEGDWNEIEPVDLLDFKPWNKRGDRVQGTTRLGQHGDRGAQPKIG